jgi:hypothetical protein
MKIYYKRNNSYFRFYFLHVSATYMAILRDKRYEEQLHWDVTEVCELMHM